MDIVVLHFDENGLAMPTRPMHFCRAPQCNALTLAPYCAMHALEQEHSRTNIDLRRLYRTARWRRRVRPMVLQQQPLCPECMEQGFNIPTVDVHHRVKATEENFWDMNNLEALCKEHHSQRTQRGE